MKAERIEAILAANKEERLPMLFPSENIESVVSYKKEFITSYQGILLLITGLMSLDQISKINLDLIDVGFTNYGLRALLDKLISLDQMIQFQKQSDYFPHVLSNNGLAILRKGLMTFEQLFTIPSCAILGKLISNCHGLTALEEQLITPMQIVEIPHQGSLNQVDYLFSEPGLLALREQLLTVEQILATRHAVLDVLLSENGLNLLREKLLTFTEISQITNAPNHLFDWKTMFSPDCIQFLRAGIINFEDILHTPIIKLVEEKLHDFESKSTFSSGHQ